MNEITLLVISSGLNCVWGFTVFYCMYLGDYMLKPFWIIFGIILVILGLFIPLEYLFVISYNDIMRKYEFGDNEVFDYIDF